MDPLLESLPRHSYGDRRQSERLLRSFPVKCRITKGIFEPTVALDISSTGLRIEANHNYTVGSEVTVHLKPSPMRPMSLQAQVMWTSPKNESNYEIGLHFTDGPEPDFIWLRKWLLAGIESTLASQGGGELRPSR